MDRPLAQPERGGGAGARVDDGGLSSARQPGRRDVDRLLEEGAVERVGLVEEREHLELAVGQQALQRDLAPGDEVLDQEWLPASG